MDIRLGYQVYVFWLGIWAGYWVFGSGYLVLGLCIGFGCDNWLCVGVWVCDECPGVQIGYE